MLSGSSFSNTFVILGHPWATRSSRSGGKAGTRGCPWSGWSAWEGRRAWGAGKVQLQPGGIKSKHSFGAGKLDKLCDPAMDIPLAMDPEGILLTFHLHMEAAAAFA